MFYKQDMMKFKRHNYQIMVESGGTNKYLPRYIFLEEDDDINTIHGHPYEPNTHIGDSLAKIITVRQIPSLDIQNRMVFRLIDLTDFKLQIVTGGNNAFMYTFLGVYDIHLMPITNALSTESFLPTTTIYDQIYVTDLTQRSIPTYFVEQFVPALWMAFAAAFLCFGLISKVAQYLYKKFGNSSTNNQLNWFSVVTNQDGGEFPQFLSGKFFMISLSLLVIIFHGAFEAFLSSSLAIRIPDLPFSNLDTLLSRSDYTICTIPHTAAHDYIESVKCSGDPQIRITINSAACPSYIKNFKFLNVTSKNIEHFPQGKFTYMGLSSFWNPELNQKSNLIPIDGKYFMLDITMQVSPGFKYREHFNIGITKARTAGHLQRGEEYLTRSAYFYSGIRRGKYKHMHKIENISYAVDFGQVVIILLIPIVGIISSVFVLLVEICIGKFSIRNSTQPQFYVN